MIIEGEQVQVIDDKSGEDLTRSVLLQIVAEQEHFGKPILSAQLLHSIVRFYGTAMEEFTGQYLEKSVATLIEQQDAMRQQMWKFVSNTPVAGMMEVARQNMDVWTRMQEQMLAAAQAAHPPEKK